MCCCAEREVSAPAGGFTLPTVDAQARLRLDVPNPNAHNSAEQKLICTKANLTICITEVTREEEEDDDDGGLMKMQMMQYTFCIQCLFFCETIVSQDLRFDNNIKHVKLLLD